MPKLRRTHHTARSRMVLAGVQLVKAREIILDFQSDDPYEGRRWHAVMDGTRRRQPRGVVLQRR